MPLKASYLLLAGGGAIVIYSGLKGKGISAAVRDVISGQSPVKAAAQNVISPGMYSGVNPNATTGSPGNLGQPNVTNPSSSSETSWIRAMLKAIGAPTTTPNVTSVSSWITHESEYPGNGFNTGGLFNPLNTTLGQPGATDYNSVGVKNYVSEAQGLMATALTLLSGQYSDVVAALRSGQGLCGQSFAGLSTWSGGGYSSVC